MAKAAVAEAKAAGVETPKNAQGLAASAIAKGADPSSVFAALITPDPVTDDVAPTDDVGEVGGEDVAAPVADDVSSMPTDTVNTATTAAEEGYAAAADATGADLILDEAENALSLLNEAA